VTEERSGGNGGDQRRDSVQKREEEVPMRGGRGEKGQRKQNCVGQPTGTQLRGKSREMVQKVGLKRSGKGTIQRFRERRG